MSRPEILNGEDASFQNDIRNRGKGGGNKVSPDDNSLLRKGDKNGNRKKGKNGDNVR